MRLGGLSPIPERQHVTDNETAAVNYIKHLREQGTDWLAAIDHAHHRFGVSRTALMRLTTGSSPEKRTRTYCTANPQGLMGTA